MTTKKQVVRKINVDKFADFDEHWWPVTLLLLTSAGGMAGYVITTGDFQTDELRRNAWFQLGVLGALALALVVGVVVLRGSSQRRLQLGVFLSLLFHAALLFTGRHVYLKYFAPQQPTVGVLDDEAPVTIPDFIPTRQPGAVTSELTRPTETQYREEKKVDVAPKELEPMPAEKEAIQEPEPQREPLPTPTELARVEFSAPRRNEVLSGEKLSRQELPDKLPTETVPQPRMNRTAELQPKFESQTIESERRQTAEAPDRRLRTSEPRPQDRPRPDEAPPMPERRNAADRPAVADARASLERRLTEAAPSIQPTPSTSPPITARTAPALSPTDQPMSQPSRQPTAAAAGRAAAVATPLISVAPAAPASAALAKAETPEPADTSNTVPSTSRSPARASAGAAVGVEAIAMEAPSATASAGAAGASGGELEAVEAAVSRGNQGLPQNALAMGSALPSPIGAGSGPTVGAAAVGPRRAVGDAGEASDVAGQAAGAARPGRGRSAAAPLPDAVGVAGAMAGAVGAAPRAGNAADGLPLGLQPAASASGASLGERTVTSPGALMRPTGGGASAIGDVGPANVAGGLAAGGAATGGGGPRRELGEVAGGAPASGRSSRAKQSAGETLTSVPGAGMVALPEGSASGRTVDGGAARAMEAAAGAAGVRREAGGLPVMVAAPEGPGGLTSRPSRDLGLPSRRARPESEVVHLDVSRLVPERLGGKRSGGGQVRDAAVVGLKQRDPNSRAELARAFGGSEETEQAVEMGLDFLARHQSPDGRWRLHDFAGAGAGYDDAGPANIEADTAGTGLALLAFLGAGYTHQDAKYGAVVEKGLTFLLQRQKPNGDLFIPPPGRETPNTWFYSHGIASIALCEALGMTRDDALLRVPAQKAIDFIVASQNREFGGWRYLPNVGSDTSVSGWQLMALKSAERVGLNVPPQTYALVGRWLDFAQGAGGDPTRYAYRPQARDEPGEESLEHERRPSRVMTAEALLMRQYLGWTRDDPNLIGGADFLLTELPSLGTSDKPNRDTYYWYYATQVMFHMKGDRWTRWNEKLRPLLVDGQERTGPLAGSWNPGGEIPDRWGHAGGRLYVTAMNLLILEVYYRYLPIYQGLE